MLKGKMKLNLIDMHYEFRVSANDLHKAGFSNVDEWETYVNQIDDEDTEVAVDVDNEDKTFCVDNFWHQFNKRRINGDYPVCAKVVII